MSEWSLAWRLARRELSLRFRGLRLLLVCLFLGVGALAAIGSLTGAISGELAGRGKVLLGGDVEFSVSQRGANPRELAAMRAVGRVSETVRMQSMAVAPGGGTAPVQLKAVDAAYPLYGQLTLAGDRVVRAPGDGEAWIARDLAGRLAVRRGDTLRLGTAGFRVGGIIGDEPDRLSEGFTLGPVVLVSTAGLRRTGLVQPGSLYETKYRVAAPSRDPNTVIARFGRDFANAGWETRTRDRASPGASRFIDRMGEFLTLVGLAALVIAGVGVGNGVSSYLEQRRSSIAMLKVLGATSRLVTRVYLMQVLAVAMIGVTLGLLAGVAATPLLGLVAGAVLPVAPGFSLQPAALVLAGSYGVLIALAFCAPALVAAGRVPAASLLRGTADARSGRWIAFGWIGAAATAIVLLTLLSSERPWFAAAFLAAAAGTLLLLVAIGYGVRASLARLPHPRRPLPRLALAALHRPAASTVTLVVALGLGLTLFVLLATIRTSIEGNIARSVPDRAPALFALDVPPQREAEFRRIVVEQAPDAQVATVPLMRGTITGFGTTRVADLKQIPEGAWALRGERGLTFAERLPPGSTLAGGRWWTAAEGRGRALVSVDERLVQALNLKLGDPLTVSVLGLERTATVTSFRRVAWDTLGFNFVLVFSPGALADVPHNLAATIDMPVARAGAVTRALLPRFPSTSVIEVGGVLAQVQSIVGQMSTAITAAAAVVVFAGIAVLIGAVAAARAARTYDAIILKVLGATRRQILAMQVLEYLLLSTIAGAVALALGTAGGWYIVTQLFRFEWMPNWRVVVATLLVGALTTIIVGLAGNLPVLRARPAASLREL